jgi:hypothetical protein
MITWKPGIVRSPDGMARMIPQKVTWASGLFVTRDGAVRRRHYDWIKRQFWWEEKTTPLVYDSRDTRLGLFIETRWVPIETCILMAWKHRKAGTDALTVQDTDGRLEWKHGDDGSEHDGTLPDEKWRPLTGYKIGCIPVNGELEISSKGRLRSSGCITQGFYAYDRMWAAAEHGFLIDLTTAARLRPVCLRPTLQQALDCMLSGHTAEDYADANGLALSTAWNYFTSVVPHLHPADLKQVAQGLAPPELWKLLSSMYKRGDTDLSGSLSELMSRVEDELGQEGDYSELDSTERWGILRLARASFAARD